MLHMRDESKPVLDTQGSARLYFRCFVAQHKGAGEILCVAHVDRSRYCLHLAAYGGGETSAPLPIRLIIADVLQHESAGILLAHNHPSGDPQPSDSDCRLTRRLATVAEALDCLVIDHLIFAGDRCVSFRSLGLL